MNPSEDFCRENHIPVLGRIPFDMTLGILTSDAKIAADEKPEFADLFKDILENLKKEVSDEAALDSER
jgi:MinD superfamily P-loop ATPase